ncbi:hypothetical protein EV363DRAFT_1583003 [Boletus edulis]|nr:hypothetical protein EV363DRAFT_1583003 [Boletus edulis]
MIPLPHSAGVVLDGKDVTSTKLFDACNDSKAKGDSEALILAANGKGDLLTVSLRPAGILGPGQAYWRGQTRFKLEIIFYIYVGKIAEAHPADKLVDPATSDSTSTASASTDATPLSTRCSAFFIANGELVYFEDFMRIIWLALDPTAEESRKGSPWVIPRALKCWAALINKEAGFAQCHNIEKARRV